MRSVSDPGVVTTRQTITPAGVQTIFDGRVYGVTFGASSSEVFVLTGRGRNSQSQIFKLDWGTNKVLSRVPLNENPGLQGLTFDPVSGRSLVSATLTGRAAKNPKGQGRLLAIGDDGAHPLADELGEMVMGALAVAAKPDGQGRRIAVVPLIYNNQLAVVDLGAGKLIGKSDTGIAPFGAAINSVGTIAYVTNWGGRLPKSGEMTLPRTHAGLPRRRWPSRPTALSSMWPAAV